jgi:hypothetical protein
MILVWYWRDGIDGSLSKLYRFDYGVIEENQLIESNLAVRALRSGDDLRDLHRYRGGVKVFLLCTVSSAKRKTPQTIKSSQLNNTWGDMTSDIRLLGLMLKNVRWNQGLTARNNEKKTHKATKAAMVGTAQECDNCPFLSFA